MEVSLKKASKVALAALLILLIGAFVFYRERVLFSDTAYIAFSIINFKSLFIQEHRYGSFITQIVPYIGQQLHLPLKAILIGYSVSFNLFYLLVAGFLTYRYKQYELTVLMGLYYFLFSSVNYFWINDEIQQAVAWMFLFLGTTLFLGYRKSNIVVLVSSFLVLSFLTFSTHFIVMIPTVFLWGYLIIQKNKWPFSKQMTALLSTLLAAVMIIKYASSPKSGSYDSVHLQALQRMSLLDVVQSFGAPVARMFYARCAQNYWVSIIVFVAGISSLLRNRRFFLAAWAIVSCLGYIIIMGISYGDLDSNVLLLHIETEWQCIGIIIAAPFVFSSLPSLKASLSVWVLVFIFAVRFCYIGAAIPAFTWRTHFQQQVLAQMKQKGITKLALFDDHADIRAKYLLDWGSGYESLFQSAMNGENPNRTFIFINKDDKQKRDLITNATGFFNVWSVLPFDQTNHSYFTIDTTTAYKVMSYDEFFR